MKSLLQQHNEETRKEFREWWNKSSGDVKDVSWQKAWEDDGKLIWQFIESQNKKLLERVREREKERKEQVCDKVLDPMKSLNILRKAIGNQKVSDD